MKTAKSDDKAAEVRRKSREEQVRQRAGDAAPDSDYLLHELELSKLQIGTKNEELRATQTQALATLNLYTDLFDFAPTGYAVIGPDSKVQELNKAAARLLGSDRTKVVGKYLRTFVAPADRATFDALMAKLVARSIGSVFAEEMVLGTRQHRSNVRLTGVVRSDVNDSILIALEDITAEKQARLLLAQVDRRKDEFIAALSHELRNPMMAISMSAAIARHPATSPESSRKAFGIIERQITALRRIVEELLDVSRLAHGKIALHSERLDLRDSVLGALEDARPSAEAAGLAIDCRIPQEGVWIDGDTVRLNQIVANLLGNAIKFTPDGGRIGINLYNSADGFAELKITDTGSGMTRAEIAQAFEPFAQSSQNADRPLGGLGLGLPIVRQLVELHGGTVTITSAGRDRGVQVLVRMPLRAAPEPTTGTHDERPLRTHRVLVIEDNLDAAEALTEVLELIGQQAKMAMDGASAIAQAREFKPHVIFCDIGLPGMDGYAVARAFRADQELKGTYLVALTGYAAPRDIQRATEAGFDLHLAKPVHLVDLKNVLSTLAKRKIC